MQGFKIHVSAVPADAERVLELAVPVCVEHATVFKVAGDRTIHHDLLSKHQARGSSGKFMTIYPATSDGFQELLERLYRDTRDSGLEGPRILSDRQYRDSGLLYYRYGGFYPLRRVRLDGTHATCVRSPEGDDVVDERFPYFSLPPWVDDPFGGTAAVQAPADVLLDGRYRVESALRFTNAGGAYVGTDTATGARVHIKEARPLSNYSTVGDRAIDAPHLLRREHRMLCRLADTGFVPQPVALFEEAGHTFLVQERLEGVNFRAFWARPQVIVAPYVRVPGRVDAWARVFKPVAEALIGVVLSLHERGVVLGDLSPGNVMIDPDSLQLWIVDFETAITADDDDADKQYSALWGTPGFLHPARASRAEVVPADDVYALGMTLCSALVPIQPLLVLNPDAVTTFVDELVALGIPVEVKHTIGCLLRGATEEARAVLAGWTVEPH